MIIRRIQTLFLALAIIASTFTNVQATNGQATKIKLGDYVQLGNYSNQPILWKVINIDSNGNLLIWSEYVLTIKAFQGVGENENYVTSSTRFKTSNLRQWLNSSDTKISWTSTPPTADNISSETDRLTQYADEPGFLTGFNENEKSIVLEVNHRVELDGYNSSGLIEGGSEYYSGVKVSETPKAALHNISNAYYETMKDKVFILSLPELYNYVISNGFDNKKKLIKPCKNVPEHYSWHEFADYWLSTPSDASNMMVDINGEITDNDSFLFCNSAVGVCPALYIDNTKAEITSGYGTVSAPYHFNEKHTTSGTKDNSSLNRVDKLGLLNDKFKKDLNQKLTKEGFADVAIGIHDYLTGKNTLKSSSKPFSDTSNQNIGKLYDLGILEKTYDNKFKPKDKITREELCYLLYKTLQKSIPIMSNQRQKASFKDLSQINYSYLEAVEFMNTYKIIVANTKNNFLPKENMSKKDFVAILDKVFLATGNIYTDKFDKKRTVNLNDRGDIIYTISNYLNDWLSTTSKKKVKTGDTFNNEISKYVKEFQTKHYLPVTGIVDYKTWNKLSNSVYWNKEHIEVKFKDSRLEQFIRNKIDNDETKLYSDDLLTITNLDLTRESWSSELTDLEGLQYLTSLNSLCIRSKNITNWNIIKGFKNLSTLELDGCNLSDITFIGELSSLTNLTLNNNNISDISPLSKLKNLYAVEMRENQISDLSPLSKLDNLYIIIVNKNRISDLSPLKNMKKLISLWIDDNFVSDLQPLKGLDNMQVLYMENNEISDIRPLSNLVSLDRLLISKNNITDISILNKFTKLTMLKLNNNGITSISPLKNLKNITCLELANNQITDLSPLSEMVNMDYLNLTNNPISDISVLERFKSMQQLSLTGFMIKDISVLTKLSNLKNVYLNDFDIQNVSANESYFRELAQKKLFMGYVSGFLENDDFLTDTPYNFSKKIKSIVVNMFTPGMSDYDKIKKVHDYLVDNITYDDDAYYRNIYNRYNSDYTGVLGKGLAVCQGYSDAARYLLRLAGIECIIEDGFADGALGRGGHAWNVVKLNGKYYQMDVTWDDVPGNMYKHFLVSDSTIRACGNREWKVENFPLCPEDYK